MRIAMLAPLDMRVPPSGYGGTELVVGLLTDGLVRRGHDVTLFASGDSITEARLSSVCPRFLRGAGRNTQVAPLFRRDMAQGTFRASVRRGTRGLSCTVAPRHE